MQTLASGTVPLLLAGLGYAEVPWWGNALLALWLWCFGANVGSFMNVVVFRMPRGRSVVFPRSRCPSCGESIRWYDNLPVLSWLLLRARCRSCAAPISARYPFVEALVAALFLVLAFLSPITSGENLPQILVVPPLRLQTMTSLWCMYAFHLLFLCTVICAALIRYDRQRPPWQLFAPALIIGVAAPVFWPHLRPVAFHAPTQLDDRWIALLDCCAGLAVGGSLGLLVSFAVIRGERLLAAREVPSLLLVGLALGWQACCAVVCLAAAAHLLTSLWGHAQAWFARIPWTALLAMAAFFYIVCWNTLVEQASWLGAQASIATFAVAAPLAAAISALTSVARPRAEDPARPSAAPLGEPHMSAEENLQAILNSPSYKLAELDTDFLQRPELRPVRVELELLKPEMTLAEQGVRSTIVAFGGTQIVEREAAQARLDAARAALSAAPQDPGLQRDVARAERLLAKSPYYDAAREFARLVSARCQSDERCDFVIITGGGPGIMEASNRGAFDLGAKSIGLNITLPEEQAPNPFITPELCFKFHYFALRKMHFLFRARALVVFPGGFGTLDELFDALTLRQTKRMQEIPIVLYGRQYWERVIDFQFLADEGVIRDEHLALISYAETPQEAWDIIARFHSME